jgi:23S rRNA (cytosine1962-C5)-methyltransferase
MVTDACESRKILLRTTNALRWINGVGDHCFGWTLDQFHEHFQIQVFHHKALAYLDEIVSWVFSEFQVDFLVVKKRISSNGRSLDSPEIEVIMGENSKTLVKENGLIFQVDLLDTINPGLFLDMRSNRERICQNLSGKTVLNGFSYTSSFGLYAARAGAKTINVDISQKILEKAALNYSLNSCTGEFIKADTREYLFLSIKKNVLYDLIIMDPPSFSRQGKEKWSVASDLFTLIDNCVSLISPNGSLFISTNYSKMQGSKMKSMISASMRKQNRVWKSCKVLGPDKDFPFIDIQKESFLVGCWVRFAN